MAAERKRTQEAPVATARLRFYRCSPQKARLVVDQVRGRNVNEALWMLRNSPKAASGAIEKLVRSAVANAEQASERVDADRLYVSEIQVGPGPSLKRFRGRAFGRAFQVLHRSCHIAVARKARPARARKSAAGAGASASGAATASPAAGKQGG